MERLTLRINRAVTAYVGPLKNFEKDAASDMKNSAIREVLHRLAEYEDTGLTPDQINVMACEVKQWRKNNNVCI